MADHSSKPDWNRTSRDYAKYRYGYPPRLFEKLHANNIGVAPQRVLDLATGTGALAVEFAKAGCYVTAFDNAAEQIRLAEARASEHGLKIDFVVGAAEQVPQPDESFDVVSVGQAWHWFERARAAREAHRLLKPGGVLLITHFDFLRRPQNPVDLAFNVISAIEGQFVPHTRFSSEALYPNWLPDLSDNGFVQIETFSFDVDVDYSHVAWVGRMRASQWVSARMSDEQIQRFTSELTAALSTMNDPLKVPHRSFTVIGRKPH